MRTLLIIISLFLLVSNPVVSQTTAKEKVELALENVIQNESSVGIAAGVINNDLTLYFGKGFSDLDSKAPFNEETITRTASIAKPMTAIAIMQLVEKGILKLENEIGDFIPEIKNKKLRKATIKQVMQQTTGIKAYKNKKEAQNSTHYPSHLDAAKVFMNRKLLFDPGEGFRYSTYNYTLLAIIIERATQMDYEEYMTDNIFKKAEMHSTSVEVKGQYPEGKSMIYSKNNNRFQKITNSSLSDRVAGGGIQSTVEDILKFANAVMNNTLISQESLNKMTTSSGLKKEGNPYGMGWYIYGHNEEKGSIIGHSGGQQGCTAMLFLIPKNKLATVVLANTSGANEVDRIANDLFSVGYEMKE